MKPITDIAQLEKEHFGVLIQDTQYIDDDPGSPLSRTRKVEQIKYIGFNTKHELTEYLNSNLGKNIKIVQASILEVKVNVSIS